MACTSVSDAFQSDRPRTRSRRNVTVFRLSSTSQFSGRPSAGMGSPPKSSVRSVSRSIFVVSVSQGMMLSESKTPWVSR